MFSLAASVRTIGRLSKDLRVLKPHIIAPFRFNSNRADLKYTEKHEWIRIKSENIGLVGITDYAQDKLGEVVYVELPTVGAKIDQNAQFATLESVKAVSECYLPVTGTVLEVNEAVKENPSSINKSPFDDGWLVKIKVNDKSQVDKLMSEKQYADFLKSEQH